MLPCWCSEEEDSLPQISKLSVLALADEPILQIGLRSVLSGAPGIEISGIHASVAQAAGSARENPPDAILYSLALDPELAQIHVMRRIAPDAALILWARDFSTELAHQALDLGIQGFLSTTAGPEAVIECLQLSVNGEIWMERSLASTMLNSRPIALSRRQGQLLGLLVQGLKNREIASEMGISEGTVKAYLTTLFEKVGARDRFELALYGLKTLRNTRSAAAGRDLRMRNQVRPRARAGVRTVA